VRKTSLATLRTDMRSRTIWTFLCLFYICAPPLLADVSVSGYYRKNGTYVAPYHRSSPDGDFSNNWSTRGNINPYTGQEGTKDYPGVGYGSPNYDANGLGIYQPNTSDISMTSLYPASVSSQYKPYVPAQYSPMSAGGAMSTNTNFPGTNISERISTAQRLQKAGYNVDWQRHNLEQMQDLETRIGVSNRLQGLGEEVPWQHKTLPELLDIQSRVEAAKRLEQTGQVVDWKAHSLGELLTLEGSSRR
jgi:hypothetical protein